MVINIIVFPSSLAQWLVQFLNDPHGYLTTDCMDHIIQVFFHLVRLAELTVQPG